MTKDDVRDLRLGVYDVVVGINLLREGLDLPEVSLVAILDADKEGYLRSTSALIQTIGFILACAVCYLLAVQGLRRAAGQSGARSPRTWAVDAFTGVAISAPVFWLFTQFLALNLPGLTSTGWI